MTPLTLDDLLPLEEYVLKRREFFDSHCRYLDRYRRLRVGPRLTLVFENRQTLWFRVQEIIRVARLADPQILQEELTLYNRLLPGPGQLQAAVIIEIDDPAKFAAELAAWKEMTGEHLRFHVGDQSYPATLMTCRPEDRCAGAAHWAQFQFDDNGRACLANPAKHAYMEFEAPFYQHQGPLLSDDLRQSLLDDLKLSDRDGATRARSG